MPQPLPEYIQSPVRDYILSQYPRGLRELSESIGVHYITVLNQFKRNRHVSLKAWIEACTELGEDPDALSTILELPPDDRKREFLARFSVETIKELAEARAVSPGRLGYLYSALSGASGKKIVEVYKPLASGLSMTLQELSDYLQ